MDSLQARIVLRVPMVEKPITIIKLRNTQTIIMPGQAVRQMGGRLSKMITERTEESEDKLNFKLDLLIFLLILGHIVCLTISSLDYSILRRSIIPYFTRDLSGGPDTTMIYHLYEELRWPFMIDSLLIICTTVLAFRSYKVTRKRSVLFILIIFLLFCIIQVIPDVIFEFTGLTSVLTGIRFLLGTSTSIPSVQYLFFPYYALLFAATLCFVFGSLFKSGGRGNMPK